MTEDKALESIREIVNRMLDDKGMPAAQINADTQLLGGEVRIDSLDLAMMVRELEDIAGFDPFSEGFIEFRTAGELAKLYAR